MIYLCIYFHDVVLPKSSSEKKLKMIYLQLKYYLHQNVSMSTFYVIPEKISLAMLFYPYPDVTIREDCM